MLRQVAEFLGCLLTRFAPQFVNRLKDFVPLICRDAFFAQKICPKFTVADSDNEIVRCKSEFTEDIDAQREKLDICCKICFTDNVAVELEMFAQTAALLFFVAKELADGEPFERFFEFALVGGGDAGQRRRQLGPQRDFAFALVDKIKELVNDLFAAFLSVKLGQLKWWTFPFDEPVATRYLAPADTSRKCGSQLPSDTHAG